MARTPRLRRLVVVIVLIRRFIRADREEEFLARYRSHAPTNPAFKGEHLTKVSDDAALPPRLRSFHLEEPSCVTYLYVSRWDSWQAFEKHFLEAHQSDFDPEIERRPRERIVLDVVRSASAGAITSI
jgi:hypothetical protein